MHRRDCDDEPGCLAGQGAQVLPNALRDGRLAEEEEGHICPELQANRAQVLIGYAKAPERAESQQAARRIGGPTAEAGSRWDMLVNLDGAAQGGGIRDTLRVGPGFEGLGPRAGQKRLCSR